MSYFYLHFLHVLCSQEQQLTQYIQDYFRAFLTCAHEISVCAYTFETHFVCYNFSFEKFFNSNCNIFSCNSALNCAITEFGIFQKQEINSFSMPSATLMDCCKILHFVVSQSSCGEKIVKIQNCFHTSPQVWIHLLKTIHLFFVPGKYHDGVLNVWVYVVISSLLFKRLFGLLFKIALGGGA